MSQITINVARQFSKYPAGRYLEDGPYSGQRFRDELLVPALQDINNRVIIEFDGARGYGSSFLEEAFGGLVRAGFTSTQLLERIEFCSQDASLIEEIKGYIEDQARAI